MLLISGVYRSLMAWGSSPVGDLVGRVLVGESGVQASLVGHVEDGVHLQELVGVDDLVGRGIDGQFAGVDAAGIKVAAAAEQGLVLVNVFRILDFRARLARWS